MFLRVRKTSSVDRSLKGPTARTIRKPRAVFVVCSERSLPITARSTRTLGAKDTPRRAAPHRAESLGCRLSLDFPEYLKKKSNFFYRERGLITVDTLRSNRSSITVSCARSFLFLRRDLEASQRRTDQPVPDDDIIPNLD